MRVTVGRRIPIRNTLQSKKAEGLYHYTDQSIEVGPDRDLSTIRHELMHCVLDLSGLSTLLPKKIEEALIVAMDNLFWPAYEEVQKKMSKQG